MGEIRDAALANVCAPELGWIESHLRQTLYQWEHFQVDRVVPPVFQVVKQAHWRCSSSLSIQDRQIKGDTGTHISAHAYTDQLSTEADLAKLAPMEVEYDPVGTEATLAVAKEVFDGLLDVEVVGWSGMQSSIWDHIAMFRGVDNLLLDLAERPDFMHQTARRFMEMAQALLKQQEEQDLLDSRHYLLHCTLACSRELPAPDAELLDLAGEVARDLPFAVNTPASEVDAVVERVAAKPTDAGNRQQVRRLRSVTRALTPAQLDRLYACLKTEPQARFELPELVAALGRAFGERCGGDAGKFGQLLGDANALPFLRGYVQAAAESTNASLKAWARTDGAILLPLANGLRAQFYRGGGKWEDNNLVAERRVETVDTPDSKLGLPDFNFGENKRVSISIRWTGFLEIKTPGKYTFHALAEPGARLWVGDTLVTERYNSNDGATIELPAGLYPLRVEYWSYNSICSIKMAWSGPGFERPPISADVLRTPAVEQKE